MKFNNKWKIILDSFFQYFIFACWCGMSIALYLNGFMFGALLFELMGIGLLIWGMATDVISIKRNLVVFLNKVEDETEEYRV